MTKINTFDGPTFWKNAYAHQRSKLLQKIDIPKDQIDILINKKYLDLSASLRFEIETRVDGKDI